MARKTKQVVKKAPAHWLCEDAGLLLKEVIERVKPPEEARKHFEMAGIEFLKGVKVILDETIGKRMKPEPKGAKIKVE
ncbi:MAG: hypothetical protein C5B50_15580 [Verrucomicrobia bacterium]|nr:MAG: hypothetical protein C5B50_15580 [Verrucomicrobiota bacterium]